MLTVFTLPYFSRPQPRSPSPLRTTPASRAPKTLEGFLLPFRYVREISSFRCSHSGRFDVTLRPTAPTLQAIACQSRNFRTSDMEGAVQNPQKMRRTEPGRLGSGTIDTIDTTRAKRGKNGPRFESASLQGCEALTRLLHRRIDLDRLLVRSTRVIAPTHLLVRRA